MIYVFRRSITIRVHQIILLFFKVNNAICLGVNFVLMRSVSADTIFFQSVMIDRSRMASQYYHYVAMISPSDYGVWNMFQVFFSWRIADTLLSS